MAGGRGGVKNSLMNKRRKRFFGTRVNGYSASNVPIWFVPVDEGGISSSNLNLDLRSYPAVNFILINCSL